MICTSFTYKICGNIAFKDGHIGVWHAQAQWTRGVEDIAWSIDDEESETNYALHFAESSTIASEVTSYALNYTLDNGYVGILDAITDAQGNLYLVNDETISQADNYSTEVGPAVVRMWAVIGG